MPEELPPWQELQYFDGVVATTTALGVNTLGQICQFNATRTAIVLSAQIGAAVTGRFSLNMTGVAGEGVQFSSTVPTLQMTWRDYGPIVFQAWFGIATGPVTFTVYESRLKDWPQGPGGGPLGNGAQDAIDRLANQISVLTNQQRVIYDRISQYWQAHLSGSSPPA